MALNRPEKGQLLQTVQVNGQLHHPGYAKYFDELTPGTLVGLVRDKGNLHDAKAIKVCYGVTQVGWVPQAVNKDLAARLDRGEKLIATVSHHSESGSKYPDLRIEVHAVKGAPAAETYEVFEFGKPSQDPVAYQEFLGLPDGAELKCRTTASRVSISLVNSAGNDYAWFRKDGIPKNLLDLAEHGMLMARITQVVGGSTFATLFKYGRRPPQVLVTGGRQVGKSEAVRKLMAEERAWIETDEEGNQTVKYTDRHPGARSSGFAAEYGGKQVFWDPKKEHTWVAAEDLLQEKVSRTFRIPREILGVRDEYDDALNYMMNATKSTTTKKETTMNFSNITSNFINTNKGAFAQAGYLEAGRIANNQLIKLSKPMLPMLARGYAETPIGKLVIANLAQMAAAQLRPQDPTLAKLTTAMTVAAYQEVIQTVDIEGWLDQLLGSPEIKRAMSKLDAGDQKVSNAPNGSGFKASGD